jgi:hypothetical protein
MAAWAVTGQGTDGSTNQAFGATDRIWLNGTLFGDNIIVGAYQDSDLPPFFDPRIYESLLSSFRQDGDHRCSACEVEIRLSEIGNRRDCGPRPAIDKRRAAGNERIAQARVGPEITEDGLIV